MAEDSAEKPIEAGAQPAKPEGPTALTIATGDGKFKTILKDGKSGKFVKKPRALPETREVTRMMREFLNKKISVDDDGNIVKADKTVAEQMMLNMLRIATNTNPDPKWGQNAIAATEWVHRRAHGKDAPGDAELGALERSGVKFVYVTAPNIPSEGELKPKEQLKPSFSEPAYIDAEVIEQNG